MPQFTMFFPSNINMKCCLKYFSICFFFEILFSRTFFLKRAQEIMHQKETEREKMKRRKEREGGRETALVNKDSKIRQLLIVMI